MAISSVSVAQVRGSQGSLWPASVARLALHVVAGRLVPALLMGAVAVGKLSGMQGLLAQGAPGTGAADVVAHYGLASYHGLTALFLGIIAALFLIRKESVHKLPRWLPQVVALVAAYGLTALSFQPVALTHWAVTLVASVLLAVGMACAVASLLVLGRCFGILPEARGLVTAGPYRHIRHPLYSFEAVAFLGMLLPVASPLSVALYGAYVGLTVLRARYEEEVLLAVFPDYTTYRRSTWRFVPGVY